MIINSKFLSIILLFLFFFGAKHIVAEENLKKFQNIILKLQIEMDEFQSQVQEQITIQNKTIEQSNIRLNEALENNKKQQNTIKKLETKLKLNEVAINKIKEESSKVQFDEPLFFPEKAIIDPSGDQVGS